MSTCTHACTLYLHVQYVHVVLHTLYVYISVHVVLLHVHVHVSFQHSVLERAVEEHPTEIFVKHDVPFNLPLVGSLLAEIRGSLIGQCDDHMIPYKNALPDLKVSDIHITTTTSCIPILVNIYMYLYSNTCTCTCTPVHPITH